MPTETTAPIPPLAHRVRGEGGVAQLTGWSPQFVYNLIARGELPAVRSGKSITVMHRDLVAYLDAHRESADR